MKRNRLLIFILIWLVLGVSDLAAATAINGKVIAKRGDAVTVEYTPHASAAPQIGDRVTFSAFAFGTTLAAGKGEVTEVVGNRAMVRVTGGKPNLKVTAVIQATGSPKTSRPQPAVATSSQQAPPASSGHGWGEDESAPRKLQPSLIDQVIAADSACDMQGALQLAERARQQQPDNAWLRQNLSAIQAKAKRDATYHHSIEAARSAIATGDSERSYSELKMAMRHASVKCGQDREVRELHAQTKQVAEMEREATIRKAKQASEEYDQWRQQEQARKERERTQREADAKATGEGLIKALTLIRDSKERNSSPPPTNTSQDDDWMRPLIEKQEKNETWQRWRSMQGK